VTFLGFERNPIPFGANEKVAVPVRQSIGGETFYLNESYERETVKLKGAITLLEDAAGKVLACKNKFGKGNVIVSTVDCLVPKNELEYQKGDVLKNMVYGKKFPFIEYFLRQIVNEVLPLEVKGDIQYGMNKLSDGWLLYLINNKGVTKFTNKEQILDFAKTAKVVVSLRNMKVSKLTELRGERELPLDYATNSFTIDVPAGEIRVVKIVAMN
jgi:hypothetical protein